MLRFKIFQKIIQKLTYDIGIDLGTSTTLISVKGFGILAKEPSVVAINKDTNQILAVGDDAKKMVGRTPANIIAVRPLKDGVISDFDMTEAMLMYFIKKAHNIAVSKNGTWRSKFKIPRPRLVIGTPSSITEVERQAVLDAATNAGAREIFIIEEPMAAAIGANLPVQEPYGSMIIDIGGGTTDIAIISMGQIVSDQTIKIAGDEIDEAISLFVKKKYNLLIGDKTAEEIKIDLADLDIVLQNDNYDLEGSMFINSEINDKTFSDDIYEKGIIESMFKEKYDEAEHIKRIEIPDIVYTSKFKSIKGLDLVTRLPKEIVLNSEDIIEPIMAIVYEIVAAAKKAIEKAPPEILSDLLDNGIVLAGGGALIKGLDRYLSKCLNTPVKAAKDPVGCVVRGCEVLLQEIELLERIKK